jgi:broad specificity phosphatase PhoE
MVGFGMSELFLVRHAQASFGTDDYDRLSELGRQQARWLGEHFRYRKLEFDRVLCGSMVRHCETVAEIHRGMNRGNADFETDPAWNEFDFQAIVAAYLEEHRVKPPTPGASLAEFSRILRAALLAWAENRLQGPLPERWQQFEERVGAGLESVTSEAGDSRRILLVSSGGAISAALRRVLDAPASTMVQMNLQLRNSSVSHLFFNSKNLHFSGFNHVPHLDHPDRSGAVTYY